MQASRSPIAYFHLPVFRTNWQRGLAWDVRNRA